jgi:hypothetical protein
MLTWSDKSVTIKCTAEARPAASFKIFLNRTKEVGTGQTLTIPEVNTSHVGYYRCVAWNSVGNESSNSEYLPLNGKITFFI